MPFISILWYRYPQQELNPPSLAGKRAPPPERWTILLFTQVDWAWMKMQLKIPPKYILLTLLRSPQGSLSRSCHLKKSTYQLIQKSPPSKLAYPRKQMKLQPTTWVKLLLNRTTYLSIQMKLKLHRLWKQARVRLLLKLKLRLMWCSNSLQWSSKSKHWSCNTYTWSTFQFLFA